VSEYPKSSKSIDPYRRKVRKPEVPKSNIKKVTVENVIPANMPF
jgi:hypothetical protein